MARHVFVWKKRKLQRRPFFIFGVLLLGCQGRSWGVAAFTLAGGDGWRVLGGGGGGWWVHKAAESLEARYQ